MSLPCFSSFVLYARGSGHYFGWYYVAVDHQRTRGRSWAASDGSRPLALIAFALAARALLCRWPQPTWSLCGALWYTGAAIGARIMALAIAQAPAERRGRAMASYSTALPLSNGVGALISGIVVDWAGYRWMYTIAGLLCVSGFASYGNNGRTEVSRIEMRKSGRMKAESTVTPSQTAPLWTSTFALLCTVQLLAYAQQAMLNPTCSVFTQLRFALRSD
jgi:MFS family permease